MHITCILPLLLIEMACAQSISYMPRNNVAATNSAAAANAIAATNAMAASQTQNIITRTPGVMANMPIAGNAIINENAAIVAANQDIAGAITNANIANIANANLANGIANANLAGLANANLVGIDGNMATFNLCNAFTITSGSPGNQGFGIQVLADGLEVGGLVAVNGQIPIFGTVAINGNVPTDGSGTVFYNCGKEIVE